MSDRPFDQNQPSQDTKDVAKEEARGVAQDAKEGARSVGQTAGAQAQHVAQEAKTQVSSLLHQLRDDVSGQAGTQQSRAAEGMRGLAGELNQMADGTKDGEGGMATGLAQQAAQRLDDVAGWLEDREPADLLEDVRRYARRNPGTFLAAAAVVGFLGGRLTRGLRDDAKDQGRPAGYGSAGYGSAGYDSAGYGSAGYGSAGYDPLTDVQPVAAGYGGRPGASSQGSPEAEAITAGVGGPVAPTDALYDEDIHAMNEGDPVYPGEERGETR